MSFLYAMTVFALVQLAIGVILYFFRWGPQSSVEWKNLAHYLGYLTGILVAIYILITGYSSIQESRPSIWLLVHGLFVGILVLTLVMRQKSSSTAIVAALCLPLVVMASSLLINGPMPLHDDARMAGFAYRIIQDSGWTPFLYPENTYYQFFHVIPCFQAIFSIVTGWDVALLVNPILVLSLVFLISLCLYLILKNFLVGLGGLSALGPILFIATPALSILYLTPFNMALGLSLISMTALSSLVLRKNLGRQVITIVVLVSISGVLTHPVYVLLILATFFSILFAWRGLVKHASENDAIESALRILPLMTLTYWTFTLIMDQITNIGKSLTASFVELMSGAQVPFETFRPTWYFAAPSQLAFSWVLLPSLTAAYVLVEVMATLDSKEGNSQKVWRLRTAPFLLLGITGLTGVCFGLITKMAGSGLHRYFYFFYLLLIPSSCVFIKEIVRNKRAVSCILVAMLVATASFYAVQDPAISPDIHEVMLITNRRGWIVAETLSSLMSPDVDYYIDPRVGTGFVTLTLKFIPELYVSSNKSYEKSLIVLNHDTLGKQWADVYLGDESIQAIENGEYNVIFSDGLYIGYVTNNG